MSCRHFTAFVLLIILALFSPIFTTANHTCHSCEQFDFDLSALALAHGKKDKLPNCKKLSTLGAEFGWRYHKDINKNETWIDICFGAKLQSDQEGWLAWGVNPQDRPQMAGTRAIIGIKQANGSLVVKTYNVTRETKLGCRLRPSDIDVEVSSMNSAYLAENNYYAIYATLVLPPVYDISKLNHVWQVGYETNGLEPLMHRKTLENMDSSETIDLTSGDSRSIGVQWHNLRMAHGILNMLGWGTFLPVGVIIARYFRRFPFECKPWFRSHISCQITGYCLGTTGWAIGLFLGHASKDYSFPTHGLIGTFIFTLTTLQMFALQLKPMSHDDYRQFWNMYHHFLGYALVALIVLNIFRGISIFSPNLEWRWAYVSVIGALALITLALEIYTWVEFTHPRKSKEESKASPGIAPPNQGQEEMASSSMT